MEWLHITTRAKRQVVDLTDQLRPLVPAAGNGVLAVHVQHTTAALTTADLDPGTDQDLLDFLDALVPKRSWRHPHDPSHAPDHLLTSLVGTSLTLPYEGGKLLLGTWQRAVLVEFDGPRERRLVALCLPTGDAPSGSG